MVECGQGEIKIPNIEDITSYMDGSREGRKGRSGAELAPSKEMDPFIMCTEVGEQKRAARKPRCSLVARSVR